MKIDPTRQSPPTPLTPPRPRLRPEPAPTVAPLPGRSWHPVHPTADQWRARPRPPLRRRHASDPLGQGWRHSTRFSRTFNLPKNLRPASRATKPSRSLSAPTPPEPLPPARESSAPPKTHHPDPDRSSPSPPTRRRIEPTPVAPLLPPILFTQDEPERISPDSHPTSSPSGHPDPDSLSQPPLPSPTPPHLAPVVWLTARDPFTVVAHWDRAPEDTHASDATPLETTRPGGRWWMRLHADSALGPVITERPAPETSGTTILPVLQPGRSYVAELGFESRRSGWQGVAISHQVPTPPDHRNPTNPDSLPAISWATLFLPPDPSAPPAFIPTEPPPFLPEPTQWAWSWFVEGNPGTSQTFAHPGSDTTQNPANPAQLQSNPASPPSSVASASNPPHQPARDFWMRINAEVILHGSTDPLASLTIADHPIPLRPDGSFSFRFAFPDGQFLLPVAATAPDGLETREAIVQFLRQTVLTGNVDEHPLPASNDPTLPVQPRSTG